VVAAGWL